MCVDVLFLLVYFLLFCFISSLVILINHDFAVFCCFCPGRLILVFCGALGVCVCFVFLFNFYPRVKLIF